MFGDRRNMDSEVWCLETEGTGTVRCGVWRQKTVRGVFGDRKNRDSEGGVCRQKEQG